MWCTLKVMKIIIIMTYFGIAMPHLTFNYISYYVLLPNVNLNITVRPKFN